MEEIKELLALLRLEEQAQKKFYSSHLENDSIKKRVLNGLSIYPINIQKKSFGIGSYPFIEAKHIQNNHRLFKPGSPIVLFSNEADEHIKGQLHYINNETVGISLYQDDFPDWINEGKIGINASFDASTFDLTKEVLENIIETKSGITKDIVRHFYSNGHPSKQPITSHFGTLNESQSKAVTEILSEDLITIVHGPPGTGKTTVLSEAALQLKKLQKKVLACAPSNAAVDHLTEQLLSKGLNVLRIGNPSKVSDELKIATLNEKIKSHDQYKLTKTLQKQADDFRKMSIQYKRKFGKEERMQRNALRKEVKKIQYEIKQIERHIRQTIWDEADVITGTIIGSYKSWNKEELFDSVILDEAGQALPTDTWVCASMGKKLVLAGDPFQLPPTIFSDEAEEQGLNISLMENWVNRDKTSHLLNIQYRMNDLIAQYSNEYFYKGAVESHESNANHTIEQDPYEAIEFIDTAGCDYTEELLEQGSIINKDEAGLVEQIYQNYRHTNIGIISPYRGQVQYLQNLLTELSNRNINTIDSFQGQEREVIIVSMVRSNTEQVIGFLKDYRRMNVAMTRAQKKLVLIGDSATLGSDKFYLNLLDFLEKKGSYRSAWEFMN